MRRLRVSAFVTGLALVVAACGGSGGGSSASGDDTGDAGDGDDTGEAAAGDEVAGTDLTEHAVPLEDVVFDTFDGGSIPLSEASEEDVLRLRDLIIPIGEPQVTPDNPEPAYVGPGDEGARDLQPDDAVLGYVTAEGEAFAYPHRILFAHEIVNDTLGGIPVLVSFCPLCNSGVVYDRRLPDGTELSFGNTSALYENDLVMYDRQTFSYWWQVPGRAIVGELSDTQLEPLPSTTATWEEWTQLHPDTKVLSLDQGFGRSYSSVTEQVRSIRAAADAGQTPFPIDPEVLEDDRLPSSTDIVGVEVGGEARAFPVTGEPDVAHDTVGGEQVVVLLSSGGGAAFRPVADGQELTFEVASAGDGWVDTQTGTRWDATGRGVDGAHEGTRLEQIPSRFTFWFAYLSSFPDATVWQG